jgi:membrane protease YdiL (CAAX protease family)
MSKPMHKLLGLGLLAVASLGLTLLVGGVWTALLLANIKTGLAIPWSVVVMAGLMSAAWLYLGGHWGPASTSAARRRALRANGVSPPVLMIALLANGSAIVALAGFWIVLRQVFRLPGNPQPDFSRYPLISVGLLVLAGAVVGAVSEEAGLRGYLQGRLERDAPAPVAILVAALVLAPGHAMTQGFVWSTLVFYLLADAAYGATAYLTGSILPGIIAHAAGLLVFFLLVWPADPGRKLVSEGGADLWFWLHVAQTVIFAVLSVALFSRLADLRRRRHPAADGEVSPLAVGP